MAYVIYDMYKRISTKIFLSGKSIDEIKEIIDNELRDYIGETYFRLKEVDNTLSVIQLLEEWANREQDKVYVKDEIDKFIILTFQLAYNFQGHSVIWYGSNDAAHIEKPETNFKDGYWGCLITHKDTDCVKAFEKSYDTFRNELLVKGNEKIKFGLL
jgi:hypothetical protein